MLQTIRKYKTSVLGLVAIGTVALAMSGFGVNLFDRKPTERYAIKINDEIITWQELAAEKRMIENRYRQMMGKDYQKMMEVFKINVQQQAIDKIIADTLLSQMAREMGFYASDTSVRNMLMSQFGGQYSDAAYRSILQEYGLSAREFEDTLRDMDLRAQLVKLLDDSSIASKSEARTVVEDEKTKYTARYVEIDPARFAPLVGKISDADIETYYNEHVSDFELPERVSYTYAVIDPAQYFSAAEITEDDIESYYSEHQADYTTEEEINARYIQVSIPKGADDKKKEELKKKAEEALKKAQEGAVFTDLVKQYSDDYSTSLSGGMTGWIKRGKMNQAFDDAAFKLLEGELSGVVEAPSAYYVIKLEEQKPGRQKELPEVKTEIEQLLRNREAPAYAASIAADFLHELTKEEKKLSELAAAKGLKTAVTSGLLDKSKDPDAALPGLTGKVIEGSTDKFQLIEVDGKSVLVEVLEFKDKEPALLSDVKGKVTEALTKRAAMELAKVTAQKLMDSSSDSAESFAKAAESLKLPVQEQKDMTQAAPSAPFTDNQMKAALFSASKEAQKPQKYYDVNGKLYVFQVARITRPTEEELQKEVEKAREQASEELAQATLRSLIEKLKARGKIDIDPMAMAGR